jgi:hypothetical protein
MKIYLPDGARRSGICINYVKSKRQLDISGWYDSFVGIQSSSLMLKDFFRLLGVTKKDCDKVFIERE